MLTQHSVTKLLLHMYIMLVVRDQMSSQYMHFTACWCSVATEYVVCNTFM